MNESSKRGISLLTVIVGVVIAAAAIAATVFAIIKFIEKKKLNGYLECDCYDDLIDDFDDSDYEDCCGSDECDCKKSDESAEDKADEDEKADK